MITRSNPKVFVFYKYWVSLDKVKVRNYVNTNELVDGKSYEIDEVGVEASPYTKQSDAVLSFFKREYKLQSVWDRLKKHKLPNDVYLLPRSKSIPIRDGCMNPEYGIGVDLEKTIESTEEFLKQIKKELPNLEIHFCDTGQFRSELEE